MTKTTTDIDQGTVAVYDSMEDATAAVQRLSKEGFPTEHVSILTQNLESTTDVHGFVTTGDVAKRSAGVGATFGGIFGLLTGAALLVVPGVGPLVVAGSLAATLIAAAEGAIGVGALSGLVGAATGHFVSKKHIPKLTEHLTAGRYLLIAQSTDADQLDRARELLGEHAVDHL